MATPQSSLMSDGMSIGAATPRPSDYPSSIGGRPSSSGPARGPMSETPGATSDDGRGQANDNEVPSKVPRKKKNPADIRRFPDQVASTAAQGIVDFLNTSVSCAHSFACRINTIDCRLQANQPPPSTQQFPFKIPQTLRPRCYLRRNSRQYSCRHGPSCAGHEGQIPC